MKKTIILILLFYSTIIHGQDLIDIYGQVSICKLTQESIEISKINSDSTSYTIVHVHKTKSGKVKIDKLIANVKILKGDSIIYNLTTDTLGRFELKNVLKDTLEFKIKIYQFLKQDFKSSWDKSKKKQKITFCISDSIYVVKTDSIIYSLIPYNSLKAKDDIKNGEINYLQLNAGDSFLDNKDYDYLENKFGFKYLFDYFEIPHNYLEKAQSDYNEVVFEYMNQKCNCVFELEYENEIRKIIKAKFKRNE